MLIQCEKCSTRYNLDEAKIPGKGAKVTCPTCKHVFIVMKGQGAAAPGAPPTGAPPVAPPAAPTNPSAPAPGKSLLDNFFDDSKTIAGGSPFAGGSPAGAPAGRGIRSWKVRVASGLVYDFTDVGTLKAWIAERKVTTADQISADGATWTVIGGIPNLDAFFGAPSESAAPTGMGAPGPAPMTGFGPTPTDGPAAPAFAAPAAPAAAPTAPSGSLADLFNSPAPGSGADPFASNGAPPPSPSPFGGPPASSNPFGSSPTPTPQPASSPFASAPTNPGTNPFANAPAAMPPAGANPFGASDPAFGQSAPHAGGADPFASAPPAGANPFGGPDPFAAAPPAPAANGGGMFGADPFAASPSPAGGAPPPMGGAPFPPSPDPFGGGANPFGGAGPKPAPPPWLAGPAPAPTPAAPAPPAAITAPPPPLAAPAPPAGGPAKPASWSSAGDVTAKPAAIPTGTGGRKIGRTVGMALGGVAVLAIAAGLFMNLERLQAMLRPVPTPEATPTPPPIVLDLQGEARDHYLRGRRHLRLDTPESYAKAEEEFRAALAKANGNPRATAGVLEAVALQKQAGAPVDDAKLSTASDAAILALREDSRSVEANRALAQSLVASGKPQEALPYLDAALASRPDDSEALFLRSKLRAADPAQAAAASEDLAKAAADTTLTRAVKARAEGAKPKSPEAKAAEELANANATAVAALAGGTWSWTPEEFAKLLPGVPVPTPPPAVTATPAPADSAVAATPTAAPATPAPTASAMAATPTPAKTPVASTSPAPARTPVAAKSPKPTRTPLAASTGEPTLDATPTPPAENTQIATANAADHFVAAQALEQAGAFDEAIAEYQQAIKLAPKSSQYKLALAGAQVRGRKFQPAAETLADIIEREPNNAGAHRLLGLLFETTGQAANACGEFQEYLRLKPQAADAGDIRTRMLRNGCQ